MRESLKWNLVLKTGFGNVFMLGRWDHNSTVLIADAINKGNWSKVEEWARDLSNWDSEFIS